MSYNLSFYRLISRIYSVADVKSAFVEKDAGTSGTVMLQWINAAQLDLWKLLHRRDGDDFWMSQTDLSITAGDGYYVFTDTYGAAPWKIHRFDYARNVTTNVDVTSPLSYSDEASGEPLLGLLPDNGADPIGTLGTAHLLPASGTYTVTLEAEIANPNGSASDVSIWYSTTSGDDFSAVSLSDPECVTVSVGAGTTNTHTYTWTITHDNATSTSYLGFGAFCGDSGLSINSVTLTITGTYVSSTTQVVTTVGETRYPMNRYNLSDKCLDTRSYSWDGRAIEYDIRWPRVYFHPINRNAEIVRMYYVPKPTMVLSATSDSDGYVDQPVAENIDYIILRCAIRARHKQQQDANELEKELQYWLDNFNKDTGRDAGKAIPLTDVYGHDTNMHPDIYFHTRGFY